MALVQPFLLKTVIGDTQPELKAESGKAYLVKDIIVRDAKEGYITVRIEKTTVGYFRTKGPFGSHIGFRRGHAQHSHTLRVDGGSAVTATSHFPVRDGAGRNRKMLLGYTEAATGDVIDEVQALIWTGFQTNLTVLNFLRKAEIFKGFPIAEGETLTIEGMEGTNSITLIIYEQWEPGDISPDQENGSKSMEYFFLNYGNTGGNVVLKGDHLYNNPVSPAEFPAFPFGKVVPAKHEIDILGILGSPRAPGENLTASYNYTKFIKLVRDREVLFDEDRQGILFMQRSLNVDSQIDQTAEGFTLIGNLSEYDNNPPLMFPAPLAFTAGDELNIYLTTMSAGAGATIAADEQELALIQRVRRIE